MPTLEQEAIILLLQDLNDRKRMGDVMLWKERAHSLLERLGAPFSPYMDTDKAETETGRETARESFRGMFSDTYEALDDLRPEWTEHDTYTKQLEEICADRRIKCERLQDKATTLKARLTRQEEELDRLVAERDKLADQLADAGNEILDLREACTKWRERVDYLESECNRIQSYCDDLMEANIRLQSEENKAAIERIEGVA